MTNNKLKIIAPIGGVIATGAIGLIIGNKESQTTIEVAKIEAKNQMDLVLAKAELEKIAKAEANKIIPTNPETANSPLELGELKDWIINFDPTSLSFETLVALLLLSGSLTSLLCILFLSIYVSIYKLNLPLENYYSGFMLKLVNFVKPYSDGFIVFYLTILVSVLTILLLVGLRLLSGF
jgi:hypothetical protein